MKNLQHTGRKWILTLTRLHVACLAPAASVSDLTQRLGTFGTVIAVDGVAAVDGLVRPRPVTYVTLEAKNSQLAGCTRHPLTQFLSEPRATGMNLLSGTTWKGVKFRIGEAKPDFRERYGSSYLYGPLQTDFFLLSHIGSNVRIRHLRTTGQPKSVVSRGGFKVSTPQTHPSSLQKMSPHDPAGILLPWAGLFTQYECGQRSPFRSRLP